MKNLKLKNIQNLLSHNDSFSETLIHFEQSSKKMYILEKDLLKIITYNEKMDEVDEEQELDLSSLSLQNLTSIVHQSFYDRIIIFQRQGNLCIVNTENLEFHAKQILHDNQKIVDIQISPSEEEILILTSDGEILCLNKMIQVELQYSLWDLKYEGEKQEILDGQISWRFDSQFFNLVYQTSKGTKSMTFNNQLEPFHSPSLEDPEYPLVQNYFEKPQISLSPICSWASNGSLIASCMKETKKKIVLWEKNVLHYESFEIDDFFQGHEIQGLFWHPNETLLFIKAEKNEKSVFIIYQKSNGRWSMKLSLDFGQKTVKEQFLKSDLIVFAENAQILKFQFSYNSETFRYSENNQGHDGLGIFVENQSLKITPYDRFLIPSPLSLTEFTHNFPILEFSFFKNSLYFIDVHKKLYAVQYTYPSTLGEEKFVADLSEYYFLRNLNIIENDEGVCLFLLANENDEEFTQILLKCPINFKNNEVQKIEISCENFILSTYSSEEKLYFLVNQGEIYFFNEEIDDLEFLNEIKLDSDEKIMKWILFDQNSQDEEQADDESGIEKEVSIPNIIYINQNDTLYYNDIKIAEDVTSFLIYKHNFLFTMANNTPYDHLYFLTLEQLHQNHFERPNPSTSSDSKNFRKRNIEKNAILVCCSQTSVQLYMPRGNFEGFHHRILLIEEVVDLVKEKKYLKAFELIRKHKLNANLLIDIDIKQFLEYVDQGEFEKEFKSKFIDLFVLDLQNSFSEELKYVLNQQNVDRKKQELFEFLGQADKVNFILEKIEKQFLKNRDKFILNLMVIFSKKSPPALKKGLELIKEMKNQDSSLETFKYQAPHLKSKAKKKKNYKDVLQYFSWLVKAEELYKLSLGLYDLELALMVAEFTQMDPKEYIVFIEDLKKIKNEIDFKVKICLYLKKWVQAAKLLVQGTQEQIQQAVELIIEKQIFLDGIQIFKEKKELREIEIAYGNSLYKKKNYKNAAFVLQKFKEESKKVLYCYQKILDFDSFWLYTQQHEVEDNEKQKILEQIQKVYKKNKAYQLLAKMHKKLNNKSQEIIYLLKGKNYGKVKQKLLKYQEAIFQEESVQKEIELAYYEELNILRKKNQNYPFWKERLNFVQQRKQNYIAQGLDDDNLSVLTDLTSLQGSETDSTISFITGMSKTGLRKNKKPRNLYQRRYKENSVYEEEWLVESLNHMDISEQEEKNLGYLLNILQYFQKIPEVKEIFGEYKKLTQTLTQKKYQKTLAQQQFEQKNNEVYDLYNHLPDFDQKIINNQKSRKFDLLIKYKDFL